MVEPAVEVGQRRELVGPRDARAASWWSRPPDASWNDAIIDRMGRPSWIACTRRVEKDLPSRIRSTANRIGLVSSPGRMK